jgi:Leucine-rich repeat (LRR) protein
MVLLKKLALSNNVITQIENLDALVNLEDLDLSFNCIKRIENLENLRRLKALNLHRNLITTIENLDAQLRLEVLIVSSCGLKSIENLKYLRRFVRLRGVCFDGNPMTEDLNYRSFLLAFVPQLISLDYKRIPKNDKEAAAEEYRERLEKLVAVEDNHRRRASVIEAEEEVLKLHQSAFADGYEGDEFWDSLYDDDEDGMLILSIAETEDVQVSKSIELSCIYSIGFGSDTSRVPTMSSSDELPVSSSKRQCGPSTCERTSSKPSMSP